MSKRKKLELSKYDLLAVIYQGGEEFHFSVERSFEDAMRVKMAYESRKNRGAMKFTVAIYEVMRRMA